MDYTEIEYKKEWDYGMCVAFNPDNGEIVAEAHVFGGNGGLIEKAESTGKKYIIHMFPRKKLKPDETP